MRQSSEFRAGEWVQVRSREEILSTLDEHGRLEGLPFMPEMLQFCGQRFRVSKRAHKTCDPPNGLEGRRMLRAVHLEEVRCGGEGHGGCQARCLIFWKDAWLKRTGEAAAAPQGHVGHCTQETVVAEARRSDGPNPEDDIYMCQSTDLSQATQPLRWWDVSQYVEDYTSGNVPVSELLGAFLFFLCEQLATAGLGLGTGVRWLYDQVQKVRGGTPYPWRPGKIPQGVKTPAVRLGVQPGELVRIRSYPEILDTLTEQRQNRGMWFDAEMVPFCGGTYRVVDRITRIINEKTGKMQQLKNDCIMLEGVVCRAQYATKRRFCPRAIYAYWREAWLEPVAEDEPHPAPAESTTAGRSG